MNIIIKANEKAVLFSSLFQHIKVFTEQINIMFESGRMYIQTMDSARVSIFEIEMPRNWFDSYELENGKSVCIGINISLLYKILSIRDSSQMIQLSLDGELERLFIHFTSENKAVFDKHFELPLIDIECELMTIPTFESQADLTMCSTNFANIVNQLKLFGDTLNVECTEEKVSLTSTTQESGKMYVDINIDDLNSFAINEGQELSLSFSLTYLYNICLYHKIAKEVEIKFTESFPMNITYYLGDENTKISFYLAPKMED